MVEQRSPKPSVACSSRVSPAKKKHLLGAFFFLQFFRDSNTQLIASELCSLRCGASNTSIGE